MDYQLNWTGHSYGEFNNNNINCNNCFKNGDLELLSGNFNTNVGGNGVKDGNGGDVYAQFAKHGSPRHGETNRNGKAHSGMAGGATKVKGGPRIGKPQGSLQTLVGKG